MRSSNTYRSVAFAALLFLGLGAGAAVAAPGEQHAVDWGNGYATNVETDTGNVLGDTYRIDGPLPVVIETAPGEFIGGGYTYRPPTVGGVPDAPAPLAAASGDVQGMIRNAAGRYGLDANRMLRVARCESGFSPSAIGDNGFSHGVFQFQTPLWSTTPQGQAGLNRLNAAANIEAAAWVMSRTGYGPWSCR